MVSPQKSEPLLQRAGKSRVLIGSSYSLGSGEDNCAKPDAGCLMIRGAWKRRDYLFLFT